MQNIEDTDEMQHKAAFHQGLQCLQRQNLSLEKKCNISWASMRENLSSGVCQQQRRRPACASAQTDQRLCYSLFRKYHI